MRPNRLFVSGLVLVAIGAILPLLMILHMLPATLLWSFAAYTSSIVGLFLGVLSAAAFYEQRRRRDDPDR